MNNTKHRSPFAIAARLIVLGRPMLPIMLAAIVMGVIGHFCATFITVFGGFALLTAAGLPSPLAGVGTAFVCILVFALLRGVLRYAEQASNHYIAFKLLALIRDKVFGALRRLTPAKLEGRDRGDLISLITADIEQLEVFYAHTISPVCIAILCVTGMTCFTASYHILPALVLLAGYLLVGIALPVWSARRGDKAAREYRQALADTNSYLLESLRGLRDILQYQNTAARAEGITVHSETLGEKQKAMKYREGVTVGAANTLLVLTALAVLGVSIRLYQNGQLGAEGVLVCTLSALSSFGPVVALANLGASLTQVFASADRVLDLLDEDPVTADVTDGADTVFTGAQAEHVSFAYAKEEVLHDLSLTIPEKKIVGITGRSGSGKSTLLNMIGGLDVPTSGKVIVDGRDLSTLKDEQLTIFRRRKIGFIFQNYNLVPVLNVFENIVLPVELDGNKVDKKFMKEVVRMLGLEDKLNNMPSNLSGGQQQRVAIARALVSKPAIVLADEPTGNLDSMTSSDVLSLLKVTSTKFHQTLVMITHNNEIAQLADRIIRIEDGKIVQ